MKPLLNNDEFPKLPALDDTTKMNKLTTLTDCLRLNEETVRKVQQIFEEEMRLGLAKNPSRQSSLLMANTYIPELPDGSEDGYFMALDLGGTHCRVIMVHLNKANKEEPLVKYFDVPQNVRLGPGVKLFDFLAKCVYDFMKANDILSKSLPIGFTFSFPMLQKALNEGILVTWTKSFNSPGVVGQDPVKMLKEAIKRREDIDVDVVAILNDTTGTLIQGAYLDHHCTIGMILGTGSNACYVERADRIEKWEENHAGVKEVIIDVEWGAFGDNGVLDFIRTDYDRQVDANSLLVGSFTFEKYFSGKYMGELARVILAHLTHQGILFEGKGSKKLFTKDSFTTSLISHIEGDQMEPVNTRAILEEFDLLMNTSDDDIKIIRYIVHLITVRAAKLVSACLSCLLNRQTRSETTVAVDGSLYKFHPRLHELLVKYTSELVPNKKFKLMLTEDGSGKGAGLVAAIATRLMRYNKQIFTDSRG